MTWYIRQYLDSNDEQKRFNAEEKIYSTLLENRPILEVNSFDKDKSSKNHSEIVVMDKYIYQKCENLNSAWSSECIKEYWVRLKNVGKGSIYYLEIENTVSKNSEYDYVMDGPRDLDLKDRIRNAPSVIQRFSIDLHSGEEVIAKLIFHISPKCKEDVLISFGSIAFDFVYKDFLDNELIKKVRLTETKYQTAIDCEIQKYVDPEINLFFNNRLKESIRLIKQIKSSKE